MKQEGEEHSKKEEEIENVERRKMNKRLPKKNKTVKIKRVSEGDFASGSRAETPQENGISTSPEPHENALLIAIIILGIIVFALIFIIIYGYYKYVRGKKEGMEGEREERSGSMREATGDFEVSSELPPEVSSISVPVKMRKRSMTFSETDEECRKYRENLTDLADKEETVENNERSRKKSVVTFVGVKEIDSNES